MAAAKLHYSPRLGRYARCVAEHSCEYGDAHTSTVNLAKAGGAELSTNGHGQVMTVSPIVEGVFSVGTAGRRETYREDGSKLTPAEAKSWKKKAGELMQSPGGVSSRLSPTLLPSLNWGPVPPRMKATPHRTNPMDFELAEKSSDPGVLAQLSRSVDPAVRLKVTRNPATALDTLESLAVSQDKGWRLYSVAAHEELGFRYQDLRDEKELAACKKMEADGLFQKQLAETPSYRQLITVPAKRWNTRPVKQRRRLVESALTQAAKAVGLTLQITGWTIRKTAQLTLGKDAAKLVQLPKSVALLKTTWQIASFFGNLLGSMLGDKPSQKRLTRRLGLGWLTV